MGSDDFSLICDTYRDVLIPLLVEYWDKQNALDDAFYWEDAGLEPPEIALSLDEYDWLEREFNADFVKAVKKIDGGAILSEFCESLGYNAEDTALQRYIAPCDWVDVVGCEIQTEIPLEDK